MSVFTINITLGCEIKIKITFCLIYEGFDNKYCFYYKMKSFYQGRINITDTMSWEIYHLCHSVIVFECERGNNYLTD